MSAYSTEIALRKILQEVVFNASYTISRYDAVNCFHFHESSNQTSPAVVLLIWSAPEQSTLYSYSVLIPFPIPYKAHLIHVYFVLNPVTRDVISRQARFFSLSLSLSRSISTHLYFSGEGIVQFQECRGSISTLTLLNIEKRYLGLSLFLAVRGSVILLREDATSDTYEFMYL